MDTDPLIDIAQRLFGSAAAQDIMRFGAVFGFAALIHARQVRREIKTQFETLIKAFDNWADKYEKRIIVIEEEVRQLKAFKLKGD